MELKLTTDLPQKIDLLALQVAVDAAAGRAVGMTLERDPETKAPVGILLFAEGADESPIDVEAVKAAIAAHSPEEDDFERMARQEEQAVGRREKLERLLERVDIDKLEALLDRAEDLTGLVEAAKRGPRG